MNFIGYVNALPSSSGLLQNNDHQSNSTVYVRPHDLIIEAEKKSENSTLATVKRVVRLGREIQIELILESGEVLKAVFTKDRYDNLDLQVNQGIYVRPIEVISFENDYII
jgi:sulfate transport system ATP-binding protein